MVTHTAGPWQHGMCDDGETVWIGPSQGMVVATCDKFKPRGNYQLLTGAPDLLALAHQYRADLRHPPSADSITRRLAAIDAVLAKVTGE